MEKTKLVWDEAEAKRQYDICRLEALMMNMETDIMFPNVVEPLTPSTIGGEAE